MELPPEFDQIIQLLLQTDTESEIKNNFAASCFAVSCFAENIPIENKTFWQMGDTKPQIISVALLAVDDAKNQEVPDAANPIYRAIFNRAKELINGEARTTNNPRRQPRSNTSRLLLCWMATAIA